MGSFFPLQRVFTFYISGRDEGTLGKNEKAYHLKPLTSQISTVRTMFATTKG